MSIAENRLTPASEKRAYGRKEKRKKETHCYIALKHEPKIGGVDHFEKRHHLFWFRRGQRSDRRIDGRAGGSAEEGRNARQIGDQTRNDRKALRRIATK